ncbi:MAG: peptidoglycan DD-metalloendopeptidase family protein [Clostridia bacterium]|nr:peptidoglycan DD-metalloendopeptidase family protein [Clostridia bacterium]
MTDSMTFERESKLSFAKVIICVILLLTALAVAIELAPADVQVGVTASAATQSQLKSKQAQLESQQKNISAKLKSLKKSKAAAQDQLDLVNELVENLQTQITTVNNQINAANAEIKEIEEEIAAKDREIENSKQKFKERMKAIYISGDMTGGLEVILCSNGMEEFISNTVYLEAMAKYDQGLIDELVNDKEGYQEKKRQVEEHKKQIDEKKAELAKKKTELDAQQKEAEELMKQIKADEEAYKKKQAEIDLQMAKARAQLDALISKNNSNSQNTEYYGGSFGWPTPGYKRITSPYGPRTYTLNGKKVSSNHKGIDIGAPSGAKIVASNGGTVVTSAYNAGGYGNYVIIDHGGGKMTVYGHMSKRGVSVGQSVTKGQQIGKVGSTGRSTGPHLHFEIRINGTAVNPINYL